MSDLKNNIRFQIESGRGLSATNALKLGASDVVSLSRKELAYMVSTISSAANKRIDRLSKAGQPIEDTVNRFSVAGKNRNELLQEFARAKDFMNNQRMSLQGQRQIKAETARKLADQIPDIGRKEMSDFLSDKGRFDKFWKAYDRLTELRPIAAEKSYKYKILAQLKNVMVQNPNLSKGWLARRMEKIVDQTYMDIQEERQSDTPEDVYSFTGKI